MSKRRLSQASSTSYYSISAVNKIFTESNQVESVYEVLATAHQALLLLWHHFEGAVFCKDFLIKREVY